MEEHFRNMFNLPARPVNSLEGITLLNLNSDIFEYTLDIKHGRLIKLSYEKQKELYELVITKALKDIRHKNEVHYVEKCKDGALHIHGKFEVEGIYAVEGVIQLFVKQALNAMDKRLTLRWGECYYKSLTRYRSPSVCIQNTDCEERKKYWEQYILKDII